VASVSSAQPAHYDVKLRIDLEARELHGREEIRFQHAAGITEWQKQPGLKILKSSGQITQTETSIRAQLPSAGTHRLRFEYTATETRGFRWLPDRAGLFTAFYCEAWMICSTAPDQRATLRLELVVPAASGLTAVGPGTLRRKWSDKEGEHFVFEQSTPAQTYLFSFGVSKLVASARGDFVIYSGTAGHPLAFEKTSDAYAFIRAKAGVPALNARYTQAFLPPRGLAQEAAGMALLSEKYLTDLEQSDDVVLMAHEIAHQWWGALVGIRSWSDFWLNEGMAEFMSSVYLEHHRGRDAYAERIARLKVQMDELRAAGSDRPLHWEKWKDAHEALGPLPYVKGALFLDRLRTELGEETFWRGIALYTSRNARRLVDSSDFQRAMEEASGRDLGPVFDQAVYH
jgi:aminopeptidase N